MFLFQTGATPLYTATEEGNLDVVELLIRHGADVNRAPEGIISRDLHIEHQTPLLIACMRNHEAIIRRLIESGANVNVTSERGSSPFLAICQHNNVELARLLIDRGARYDVEAKNLYDGTINGLIVAAESGSFEILRLLIENGLDVNYKIEGKVRLNNENHHRFYLLYVNACFRVKLLVEHLFSVHVPKVFRT